MQQASGDPKVHVHPRLLERLRGGQTRRLCRHITGYIPRAAGGHQNHSCVRHQRPGRHPQRESSTCAISPVGMNVLQRFCLEGVAWKHLRHPNVLPLLGVTVGAYRFAMVSEWMEHGNIVEFVRADEHVNRTELVCHPSIPTPQSLIDMLFSWLTLRMVWRICMASTWFTGT
jgi:hypothetical protein